MAFIYSKLTKATNEILHPDVIETLSKDDNYIVVNNAEELNFNTEERDDMPLEKMTVKELREKAKELNIPSYSSLNKAELITVLKRGGQ